MACTFRVAGPAARLGLPEIRMGLIPGFGGTQLLPRLIGEARAIEIDRKSTRLTPVTNAHLVCRLLLEKKKQRHHQQPTYTRNALMSHIQRDHNSHQMLVS